ncbi:MAG TPA: hypothetical protein VI756_10800 [Blastocatellia bacterium]
MNAPAAGGNVTTEDPSLNPRVAIERWRNKEIDGTALLRRLVSYDKWMVPVSEAAAGEMLAQGAASRVIFNKDPQGVSRLFIFSDAEAYRRFREAAGTTQEQHFLTTKGTWVFRVPSDAIDFLAIDTASPHEIAYGKELFPRLKEMADAVEVEEALLELRTSDNPRQGLLALVRDYPAYSIAMQKTDQATRLGMAPDSKGRALAAVFTHDDGFDAYYEDGKRLQPEGELLQMNLAGPALFEHLSRMQFDGIVFNCNGPAQPIAFALQFAEVALKAK